MGSTYDSYGVLYESGSYSTHGEDYDERLYHEWAFVSDTYDSRVKAILLEVENFGDPGADAALNTGNPPAPRTAVYENIAAAIAEVVVAEIQE